MCVQDSVAQIKQHIHWRKRQERWKSEKNTGRKLNLSAIEHSHPWADRKDLASETNGSVISELMAKENHITNWSGAIILDRESHWKTRQSALVMCKLADADLQLFGSMD